MNLSLYAKVKNSARYCRDLDVRKKIGLFLEVIENGDVDLSCRKFGVSRRSYSRWWQRYRRSEFDASSLKPQSRRPHRFVHQMGPYVVSVIKRYRLGYRYGPVRILKWIKMNHRFSISTSTIRRIIEREGWVLRKYRTQKINPHRKRYSLEWPGYLQMDIKYVPEKVDGEQWYVFNAIDDCTRWRYAKAYKNKTIESAVDFAWNLAAQAPFKIHRIQTDNDRAFTYRYSPHFDLRHPFVDVLTELGIKHRLIPPGAKELNGKVERSHRTDDEEFYWKANLRSFEAFEDSLATWILEYNYDRPHSSLNDQTPMEKWLERFLTALTTAALQLDVDISSWYAKRKTQAWRRDMETYLRYHDWITSDPFHGTDVLNYYRNLSEPRVFL